MSARLSPGNEKEKGFYYGVPEGKGGEKDRRMENLQLVRRNEVGGEIWTDRGGSTRKSAAEEGRFVDFFLLDGGPRRGWKR